MRILRNDEIKEAYGKFLDKMEWSYFFTLTTVYGLTEKSARRLVERWFNKFKITGSRLFWGSEKYESKDGCHMHGLLFMPVNEQKLLFKETGINKFQRDINKMWHEVSGGNNRAQILRFDNKKDGGGYCTKYINKNSCDYDLIF